MFCRYRITAPSEMEVFEELCSSSWSDVVEGRVEICMNNEYQSVCDDRWDVQEARIVCQQLLHSSKGEPKIRLKCTEYNNVHLYVYNQHMQVQFFHIVICSRALKK